MKKSSKKVPPGRKQSNGVSQQKDSSVSQSVSLKSRGGGRGGKSGKETMIQLKALEKKLGAKIETLSKELTVFQ